MTVEEANKIQAEWMALESNAPEKKQKRVFALMDKFPKKYLSIHSSGATAVLVVGGMPCNQPMPIADVIRHFSNENFDRTIAWSADKWIPFPEV